MDNPSLSKESHVLLLLASHLGAGPDEGNKGSGLGPAGWQDFAAKIQASELASPGELLRREPADWPEDIWTKEASRDWVEQRLGRSSKLAVELEDLNNRGIWVTTLYESTYPKRLLSALKRKAPPFLYVAGQAEHLQARAVGFVGSRDVDDDDKEFTRELVAKVIDDGLAIVSGGAKGIDRTSEDAGLEHGGPVIEFPTEGLKRCLRKKQVREAVLDGTLTLASQYHPKAPWNVGAAMGRNKLIHAFAGYTVVVRSGDESGGTWEGSTENLRHQWSPLLVWAPDPIPPGNQALIEKGGIPIDPSILTSGVSFKRWLRDQRRNAPKPGVRQTLDSFAEMPDGPSSRERRASEDPDAGNDTQASLGQF